jgi:light-regulated signal transduction histidine kinase (bacteriophytochrome)
VCATIDGQIARPGTVLSAADYPAYFEAMRTQRLIVADDARSHPATREFAENYLGPLGITSMLDAPIVIGDRLVGVVCHEHTGELRAWTTDEQTFAGAAASLVGLAEQSARTKAAELDLRRLNEELERRVEARTSELEAFSYSVSHDLRAPLRAMSGFSRVLASDYQDQLDDAGRDYLSRIVAAANKMGRLIDALLSLSRYSHQPVEPRNVDLAVMAHAVVTELRDRDPSRACDFVCEQQLGCRGDRELLEVLLRNLMENAWKFTRDANAPRIEVGARPKGEGERQLTFYVRDNGIGFDTGQAGSLFKPFTKLRSARVEEGTGIGLATVMRIAQRHGGHAWAEGTPGEGATFFFTLDATETENS